MTDALVCEELGVSTQQPRRRKDAVVESSFASLKREWCKRIKYKTREDAKADIFDYIERFYNRKRRHSYLDYLTPVHYEKQAVGN